MEKGVKHKVSVIVPVFNAEQTIAKCLESIRKQTYKEMEIIVVNDGSIDGSMEEIRRIRKEDKRIRCIEQENGGVGKARNIALDNIKGEYVVFIDADDYVEKDFVEILYEALQQNQADISLCWEKTELPNGELQEKKVKKLPVPGSFSVYGGYSYTTYKHHEQVTKALFKASIIHDIRFAEDLYVAEDTLFFAMAAKRSKKIVHTYLKLYHYVIYEESACHGKFSRKKYTELEAWKRVCSVFEEVPAVYVSARCGYALRCYEIMRKYYEDELFRKKYYKNTLKEYRKNVKFFLLDQNTGVPRKIFRVLIAICPKFFNKYWR